MSLVFISPVVVIFPVPTARFAYAPKLIVLIPAEKSTVVPATIANDVPELRLVVCTKGDSTKTPAVIFCELRVVIVPAVAAILSTVAVPLSISNLILLSSSTIPTSNKNPLPNVFGLLALTVITASLLSVPPIST